MITAKDSYLAKKSSYNKRGNGTARELDILIYWTTLLVLAVANFFVAVALIPFLVLSTSFHFYLLISLLGLFFGYVFNLLVSTMQAIDRQHHMIAAAFVPLSALMNLAIISASASTISVLLGIEGAANPFVVSTVYVAFFVMPYAIRMISRN